MSRFGRGTIVGAVALATAAGLGACGGSAHAVDEITVAGAWARTTPAGAVDGVAYLSIESPVDDRLLQASVPASVAASATIHESMLLEDGGGSGSGAHHGGGDASATGGGVATETTIDLPAGELVALEPGGRHVMLMGLAHPLRAGDRIPLTLTLEVAGSLTVEAEVAANAP